MPCRRVSSADLGSQIQKIRVQHDKHVLLPSHQIKMNQRYCINTIDYKLDAPAPFSTILQFKIRICTVHRCFLPMISLFTCEDDGTYHPCSDQMNILQTKYYISFDNIEGSKWMSSMIRKGYLLEEGKWWEKVILEHASCNDIHGIERCCQEIRILEPQQKQSLSISYDSVGGQLSAQGPLVHILQPEDIMTSVLVQLVQGTADKGIMPYMPPIIDSLNDIDEKVIVRILIKGQADININFPYSPSKPSILWDDIDYYSKRITILGEAVRHSKHRLVRLLIDAEAAVNCKSWDPRLERERNYLQIATDNRDISMISILIRNNCQLDYVAEPDDAIILLYECLDQGSIRITQLCLDTGLSLRISQFNVHKMYAVVKMAARRYNEQDEDDKDKYPNVLRSIITSVWSVDKRFTLFNIWWCLAIDRLDHEVIQGLIQIDAKMDHWEGICPLCHLHSKKVTEPKMQKRLQSTKSILEAHALRKKPEICTRGDECIVILVMSLPL